MNCAYNKGIQCRNCGFNSECEIYKENADLNAFKEKCKFNVSDIFKDIETENNLAKAKDIMKRLVDLSNSNRTLLGGTWHETIREAEDFLSKV